MTIDSDIEGDPIEEGVPMEAQEDEEDEESSEDDYLDDEEVDDEDEEEEEEQIIRRTYVPNVTPKDEMDVDGEGADDELECDLSAYVMYHKAEAGYPCLSFDILEDGLGSDPGRVRTFPQTAYLVAGTQADKVNLNKLMVLKLSRMGAVKKTSEEDDEEEEEEEEEEELPDLQSITIPHAGCVNRIRARKIGDRTVAATFSELGVVHLWDLNPPLAAIEDATSAAKYQKHHEKTPAKPVHSFSGHGTEGFAIDWSSTEEGTLATGDCAKRIFVWKLADAGWNVDQTPLTGHSASVEDIQWSPNESTILASCSVDRSIRIWDTRQKGQAAITVPDAHTTDVNVLSWNRLEKAFILSGGDDGAVKVWDLRQFRRPAGVPSGPIKPVATFKHHQAPITSVQWHPTDGTVFAASSDDNQITLWDLAVEADGDAVAPDAEATTEDDQAVSKLPPQLLFIHQGLKEVKELHWHPQLPGVLVSTALSGFDIFRTISV